jgi:hypothetical protein
MIDDPDYEGSATATLEIGITALVRHLTSLNGGIDGSLQTLTTENATLNGSAWIVGDLLTPGTPQVRLNGSPAFGGTLVGPGAATPSGYTITLNGGAALRHLVQRIDPLTLPVVAAPPEPAGTRSVSLNSAGQDAGDFATLRNLTVNSNVGLIAVPPGTYGNFTANGGSGFVLGIAGATQPSVYNLQNLSLNSSSQIQIAGPVILTLNNGFSINSNVTFSSHPVAWFTVLLASGGLTLNGADTLTANVVAPAGTVTLNGNATLRGTVKADRLIVNGNALLENP